MTFDLPLLLAETRLPGSNRDPPERQRRPVALENPDDEPDYSTLFRSYLSRLREDFYTKRRKILKKINATASPASGT